MPLSAFGPEVRSVLLSAMSPKTIDVNVNGKIVAVQTPFPSPHDWRDKWIYMLMIDRFNNPVARPRSESAKPPVAYDGPYKTFQGGTFEGVRCQLDYLKDLGVGAIWLSPVLKNCPFDDRMYHGYGIHDFLHAEPRYASDIEAAKENPDVADNELRRLIDEIHARGMYVVFDIVLNHCGNIFSYVGQHGDIAARADYRETPYPIMWNDENGKPAFPDIANPPGPISRDAAVWPQELHDNALFRRRGEAADVVQAIGDFKFMKQMVSEAPEIQRVLTRAYQYLIARFDVDAFRIDSFKVPNLLFGKEFCNSIREFALSIGKDRFFTFGEITVDEHHFSEFIGRNTRFGEDQPIGIDAATDFAAHYALVGLVKHGGTPRDLAALYEYRKHIEDAVVTSHGEASGYFVTFLDNHDNINRFYHQDSDNPHKYDDQVSLAVGILFCLQGIPSLYYGTEQGLHGDGPRDMWTREALWGKPAPAFNRNHPFYKAIQKIAAVRSEHPALKFGRQYFRQISGDGVHFGVSDYPRGVLAFSRILHAQEVIVVANCSTDPNGTFKGEVIVDGFLNAEVDSFDVLYSNKQRFKGPGKLLTRNYATVSVKEVDGGTSCGPIRAMPVTLQPLEIQILGQAAANGVVKKQQANITAQMPLS
jgi:glycosidase